METLTDVLEHNRRRIPEVTALVAGQARISWREIYERAATLAAYLRAGGLAPGERIACILPNRPSFCVVYWACALGGYALVPINPRLRRNDLRAILTDSGAAVLFHMEAAGEADYGAMVEALRSELPALRERVFAVDDAALAEAAAWTQMTTPGGEAAVAPIPVTPDDVFAIVYTSGTTGLPKGAMLTHRNLVVTARKTAESLACTPDDVFLVAVPLYHIFGICPSILTAAELGARVVLMETFKADAALELCARERVTVHHGVPTMFVLELASPKLRELALSSLRTGYIAGAPCPIEVVRRIRTEMNCNVLIAYGLTETSPTLTATSFDDDDAVRAETVGRPLPGAEVRVRRDTDGTIAGPGEIGELECRGYGVMKGYWNKPQQTAEVLSSDGWFKTGDLATIDERNYVRIVGRKKEMIVRGGYKIYPAEVEGLLYEHSLVRQVAIVGVEDPVLGEHSVAAVVPAGPVADDDAAAEDLRAYVRGRLADYKVPDRVVFLDALPMTASGKVQKHLLRGQLPRMSNR
ncbi:long-chain fatty acid--CoA ligase [bacterium]|nr:MAG: long-chain fatty acid--CoA ligase [bacterium]